MATVKYYIRDHHRAGKLRTDEVRIIARITKSRIERFEIRTEEQVQPKFWDAKNQQVKSTCRGHYEINASLQELKTYLLKLYRDNQKLSFKEFKALVQKKPEEKKTLFSAYSKFLEAYRGQRDKKTVAKFETLLVRLTDFDKIHPFDLMTLDFNFYDAFKNYLLKIPNPFYKKYSFVYNKGEDVWEIVPGNEGEPIGIFDDQVYAYLVQLKTFLAWAEKREYRIHTSYKSWEIIRRVHDPITLTARELEQLETALITSDAVNTGRDYLAFECRTGQRISDIKRFDLKDFSDFKWKFTQRKGNRLNSRTVEVHFTGYCAPALDILQKHNWKMPVLSEQKINKNIHKACKAAGIDKLTTIYRWAGNKKIKIEGPKHEFITSHIGRKTFITLGLQAKISAEYMMQFTGITEYKTLNHYKAKFEDSAVKQELDKIPGTLMRKAQ